MQIISNGFIFFTFFMVPFLGGNHLPLHYISIDRFWLEGIFGLLLVCSVTLSFITTKKTPAGLIYYLLFLVPFLAMSVISLSYSWHFFNSLLWLSVLLWAVGCVYLYALAPNKDMCLIGLVAGATFISISAIIQLKILFPNLWSTFTQGLNAQTLREQSGIPFASYMYHNILGGYLAFILPLALYFGLYKKSILALAAAVIIGVGVVITSTRIGLAISLLTYLVTFAMLLYDRRRTDLPKLTIVAALTVVMVLGVLYDGGTKYEVPDARVIIAQKAKAVSTDISTLNTRTDIWKNGFNAYKHSPFVGFGAGAFEYAYRRYFDGNSYTGVAHSTLLKIAVELGAVGVICFVFFLLGVGLAAGSSLEEPRKRFILLTIGAGFLFSLLDFSFDVKSHVITFFVLGGGLFIPTEKHLFATARERYHAGSATIFSLLIICLLTNFFFGVRTNSFRTSIQSGDLLMETGLPVNALYPYRDATETMPLSTEGYTRALSALLDMYSVEKKQGTRDSMLKEMTEYVSVLQGRGDKDSEVYFVLGKTYAATEDHEKAAEHFRLALNYYPSSAHYVYEIAGYYASNANTKKAMEVIRSFDPFIEKHRGPHNPRGIFVYKIRDLESDLCFKNRDTIQAFKIAYKNDEDAKHNVYLMTSAKARSLKRVDQFRTYLTKKADMYRAELPDGGYLQ